MTGKRHLDEGERATVGNVGRVRSLEERVREITRERDVELASLTNPDSIIHAERRATDRAWALVDELRERIEKIERGTIVRELEDRIEELEACLVAMRQGDEQEVDEDLAEFAAGGGVVLR